MSLPYIRIPFVIRKASMFNWLKKDPSQKSLGQRGEEFARQEYRRRGYKIVAANFFNKKGLRLGELDFVAADRNRVVFVEVKTRNLSAAKFGGGAEAVDRFKQIKLLKAVKVFLQKNPKYGNLQPQIDVCLVEYSEVDNSFRPAIIIPNAVEDWN